MAKVATNYFTNKKLTKERNEEPDDPDMNFLKSLIPDIKALNPKVKIILKYDMLKLVNDANEKMEMSPQDKTQQYNKAQFINPPMKLTNHKICYITTKKHIFLLMAPTNPIVNHTSKNNILHTGDHYNVLNFSYLFNSISF